MSLLLSLARHPLTRRAMVWLLIRFPALAPIKRLYLDQDLVAFSHPAPAYPTHILILPRKRLTSTADLQDTDGLLLVKIMRLAESLARKQSRESTGWQLIANAGAYQEVPHLHFHLVSGTFAEQVP